MSGHQPYSYCMCFYFDCLIRRAEFWKEYQKKRADVWIFQHLKNSRSIKFGILSELHEAASSVKASFSEMLNLYVLLSLWSTPPVLFFFGWFFCLVFYFPVLFLHLMWVAQSTEKFLVSTKVNLVIDLSADLQKMLLCKSFILVTSHASCFYLVGQRDSKCSPTRTQYWWSVIRLSNWEDLCVCVVFYRVVL